MQSIQLTQEIKAIGLACGFHAIGITEPKISNKAKQLYQQWIENNYHANMHFMHKTASCRLNPQEFLPEVKSIICCRWDCCFDDSFNDKHVVKYAQATDYHHEVNKRLNDFTQAIKVFLAKNFAENIVKEIFLQSFCDTQPVAEKTLAMQAGLGWIGKNSLLVNKASGSSCFLGEIYTNLDLNPDLPEKDYCGNCRKCIDACPTQALTENRTVNANKCIAYLTLVHKGDIPVELSKLIGTQVIGCGICQKCCPWNKTEKNSCTFDMNVKTANAKNVNLDLNIKNILHQASLTEMLSWDKNTYQNYIKNTPLDAYVSYEKWLRNVAIAINNSPKTTES